MSGLATRKIDMIKLRWVLLALYAIIVLGLLGTALTQTLGSPVWLGFFNVLGNEPVWTIVVLLATVVSQAVFVFCSGTINLCQPIRKRRSLPPVIIAAFLLTVLVVASFFSLVELIKIDFDDASVCVNTVVRSRNWWCCAGSAVASLRKTHAKAFCN